MRYVPGSRVISVTCAGDGRARRALLSDLAGSLGSVEEACSFENKDIRIATTSFIHTLQFIMG